MDYDRGACIICKMDNNDKDIHNMNYRDGLRRSDLNLLPVFDALMRERSVTRAAARVYLSQPAMSNALNRLREMLDDPVLVRTADGMRPTPRALALEGPLRMILNQLDRMLCRPPPFDPATSRQRFSIAMTEYGESVVLPPLVERVAGLAPGIAIEALPLGPELPEDRLESGGLQLVIGVQGYFEIPARLRSRPWIEDRLVCLVRKGHAAAGAGRLSLARYLDCRHVYPSPLGRRDNILDAWLADQGKQRSIAVAARSYWAAARIAARTDYVLSVPQRVAEPLARALPLALVEPPRGTPRFRLELIWHPLQEGDGGLQWLLDVLAQPGLPAIQA